jgi:DNA-binding response OmpR family regulator
MNKKKILIIEDDRSLQRIYKTKLQQEGYEVIRALDGPEGIEKLRSEKPDLILLDLVLPKIDGFEVLKNIRKNKETSGLPVIILSNLGQKEDIERGLNLGADDYLIKAMHPLTDILMRVRKHLQKIVEKEEKKSPYYNIDIKESILDGPKLASDFNFRGLFNCPSCGKKMVLQLIPKKLDKSNRNFSACFICLQCKKSP